MLSSDQVETGFKKLYEAFVKSEKNDGRPVDATALAPVAMALELAATFVGAVVSISESQKMIARKDSGYKPGDDVDPSIGQHSS